MNLVWHAEGDFELTPKAMALLLVKATCVNVKVTMALPSEATTSGDPNQTLIDLVRSSPSQGNT